MVNWVNFYSPSVKSVKLLQHLVSACKRVFVGDCKLYKLVVIMKLKKLTQQNDNELKEMIRSSEPL